MTFPFPAHAPVVGVSYRYFRWRITQTVNNGHVSFQEADVKVSATQYPTSAMTSNSAPSPLVASASSEFSASFAAWKAFDNSVATGSDWVVSTAADGSGVTDEWLKIDLGSGNEITPTAYEITPSNTAGREPPHDWTFEGSNDDSNWTTLDTQSGVTAGWTGSVAREFTL